MASSHLDQLSAVIKAIRENLQLLDESKVELLRAIRETDEVADELRRYLEEAQKLLNALAE